MLIENYYEEIQQPWGNLFYQLLFQQLSMSLPKKGRILDFGSGFGRTASFLSETHEVVAYEPNSEMLALRFQPEKYQQLTGDFSAFQNTVSQLEKFDAILIHNVLEYVAPLERGLFLNFLTSRLNQQGKISVVKHNRNGTIFAKAVLQDNPALARKILAGGASESINFGSITVYESQWLVKTLEPLSLQNKFGLRTFFGLSQNVDVKFTKDWQQDMLALEVEVSQQAEFINVAMFHHLIFG